MTGAVVELSWDDTVLREAAARLRIFGERQSDAMWDAVGHSLASYAQGRFDSQTDPAGAAWKPSQRALATGGQTLYEHGFLFASQTYNVLPGGGVEQGSNRPYAVILQDGGDITIHARSQQIYRDKDKVQRAANTPFGNVIDLSLYRFVKKSKATYASWVEMPEYKIHIDARPYLGMSDDNAKDITGIASRHEQAALLGTRP